MIPVVITFSVATLFSTLGGGPMAPLHVPTRLVSNTSCLTDACAPHPHAYSRPRLPTLLPLTARIPANHQGSFIARSRYPLPDTYCRGTGWVCRFTRRDQGICQNPLAPLMSDSNLSVSRCMGKQVQIQATDAMMEEQNLVVGPIDSWLTSFVAWANATEYR